jgi:parvulin-like peptidyl-prolyl isomerase
VRSSSRLLALLASFLLLAAACGTDALGGAPATVDGEPVSREQLENAVRELAQDAPEDNRGPATEQIQRQVLTLLIQAKAIEQLADEQGVELDEAAAEERYQQELEGLGGEDAAREMLAVQNFTLELFRDVLIPVQQRVDVLRERLAADEPPVQSRTVRHILVETEEEADDVVAELEDGADFAELAAERSTDPGSGPQGGDLGPAPRGAYVPEFDDAAWEAELDEVVGPVESAFGYHVLQVTAIEETPIDELDVQQLDQLVGRTLQGLIDETIANADVSVDPAIGRWDPESANVVPTGRVGDGSGSTDRLSPGGGGPAQQPDDGELDLGEVIEQDELGG